MVAPDYGYGIVAMAALGYGRPQPMCLLPAPRVRLFSGWPHIVMRHY